MQRGEIQKSPGGPLSLAVAVVPPAEGCSCIRKQRVLTAQAIALCSPRLRDLQGESSLKVFRSDCVRWAVWGLALT